jgi:hypothetical protein
MTAREYLIDRFQTDAAVLRERVALMTRGTKVPGPNAATSRQMADACHEVAAMLLAIAGDGDADATLDAITALLPLLEHRADEQKSNPAVRSVYAGAATRIREVRSAEAQSAHAGDAGPDDPEDDALGELDLADDADDADADDDDIDDDTLVFDDDRADGAQ